eukprot:scaffold11186_cov129-Isochrysis_galbana.AAC.1
MEKEWGRGERVSGRQKDRGTIYYATVAMAILRGCLPSSDGKSASGVSGVSEARGRPALAAHRSRISSHRSMSTADTWFAASTLPPGRRASTAGLNSDG